MQPSSEYFASGYIIVGQEGIFVTEYFRFFRRFRSFMNFRFAMMPTRRIRNSVKSKIESSAATYVMETGHMASTASAKSSMEE